MSYSLYIKPKRSQIVKFFANHPLYSLKYVQVRLLRSPGYRLQFRVKETLKLVQACFHDGPLITLLEEFGFLGYYVILYVVVRWAKPEVVVETGTGAGLSSTFILQALQDNNRGSLYSIEARGQGMSPDFWIPARREPGWLVPSHLRKRLKLMIGESKNVLPSLLGREKIDIFFHDSEHTYENMIWEYRTVWPSIKIGGFLISHDVDLNAAFIDFANEVGQKSILIGNTGLIHKNE